MWAKETKGGRPKDNRERMTDMAEFCRHEKLGEGKPMSWEKFRRVGVG